VRVNRLPHYRSKTITDKRWPKIDGFRNINVCSSAHGIWKELSPMNLGPIESGGVKAQNLENLWQFSKVWQGEVNNKGEIVKEFFERRAKGFKDKKGHRWVKKGTGINRNIPLFSYWNGERLLYLEARKKIYCPLYAEYVVKTKAYKELEKMINDGYNVQIIGYDGYDFGGKQLRECFNDISVPFGHELVLACVLLNQRVWEDDNPSTSTTTTTTSTSNDNNVTEDSD